MKIIICFALSIIISTNAISQNSKVTSAINSVIDFSSNKKIETLEKARISIDTATINEKTSTKSRTWFARGLVYFVLDTVKTKLPTFPSDALEISMNAFIKSYDLDSKYSEPNLALTPILTAQFGLDVVRSQFISKSVKDFEKQDYASSYKYFEKAISIDDKFNKTDTLVVYYSALAAENAKMYSEAKKCYYKILNLNLNASNFKNEKSDYYKIYFALSSLIVKNDHDTTKALEIMKKGREAFSDNSQIIFDEINLYLSLNKLNEVNKVIDLAINSQPLNPYLYNIKGYLFNTSLNNESYIKNKDTYLNNFSKAEELYNKSISLDSKFFDPYYNLGLLYINKANAIIGFANSLVVNDPRYIEEKYKAMDVFKLAVTPLEKASDINPKDKDPLTALKQVYYRLSMKDKENEIKEKINKL